MNKIKVNNIELLYKVKRFDCGDYGASDCYETIFYDTTPIKKYVKRYIFFGPIIYEKETFEELFRISVDINSIKYTKDEIRDMIERNVKLLNRKKEIERGEII